MTNVTRKQFLRACAGCLCMPIGESPTGTFEPAYLGARRSGELRRRSDALRELTRACRLCPRECGARRLDGETGFCGAGRGLEVSSYAPHFGEERGLVGRRGSGTIFLTHCNLRCVFCQNGDVSQGGHEPERTPENIAVMMRQLQDRGCHNINLVTPTHYTADLVRAIDSAAARGLRLPIVWNTSGWERLETLRLLDGIVDIYMPDFKYADPEMADRYSSGARSYPEVTRAAILEMHRQVGVARPMADGVIRRGLIIRHLVMPNGVSGTREVIGWIARNLPKDSYVNLLSQYRPAFRAGEFPAIARRLERREYDEAVQWARGAGLTNLDLQGGR